MHPRVYLLKIELAEAHPAIWRQFVVPATISLDRLHDVIQIVMGWNDSHLYEFTIGKKRYTESPEFMEDGLEAGMYRLVDLIKQKGRTFNYVYDFGDNWQHTITILDSRYVDSERMGFIACHDGERACPPDDVGGVYGYFDFCHALKDPLSDEHESCRHWIGDDFDPEVFKMDDVNWELMKYWRWSRDRNHSW